MRLKKPHPCGGYEWVVVRLGADIGLKCQGCSRRVLLPRRELERRLKQFVHRGTSADIQDVATGHSDARANVDEAGP